MNLPLPRLELEEPTRLILDNYHRWLGRDLVSNTPDQAVEALFLAPFAVLSTLGEFGTDHAFNYANQTALELFEYRWTELMGKPSSASAEPVHRDERRRFLDEVGQHGFIENYSGIRISQHGHRFRIERATVFNLLDAQGTYVGQAATFADWQPVS
jgi:PAS domain-containing protein